MTDSQNRMLRDEHYQGTAGLPAEARQKWADRNARIDARMLELGLAEPGTVTPGHGRYYGYTGNGMEEEAQAERCAYELGEMPSGAFASPAIGRATWDLQEAQRELGNWESLPADERVGEDAMARLRADVAAARQKLDSVDADEWAETGEPSHQQWLDSMGHVDDDGDAR